eukprot:g46388.t1
MRPRQDWCSSLGAQAQKLFKHSCEEAPLMELAKWGLAVLPRLLEAGSTGDFGCNQEGGAIHAPAKAQVATNPAPASGCLGGGGGGALEV